MTDDEILEIARNQAGESKTFEEWALSFSRAVQPAQPKLEPVAFINVTNRTLEWAKPTRWETPTVVNMPFIPLYTAPPKKEWVELTKEECFELCVKYKDEPFSLLVAVRDKIREKNIF